MAHLGLIQFPRSRTVIHSQTTFLFVALPGLSLRRCSKQRRGRVCSASMVSRALHKKESGNRRFVWLLHGKEGWRREKVDVQKWQQIVAMGRFVVGSEFHGFLVLPVKFLVEMPHYCTSARYHPSMSLLSLGCHSNYKSWTRWIGQMGRSEGVAQVYLYLCLIIVQEL
ncbi:uncharacterized protein [Triticum aestivum]|uniref:uncharacterized protein isoform X1 n=1 Tax=Triticum aestivum TaxID=4565 RepID=UPI001D02F88D|nr:uncharacterized protein LOC123188384 isoform X1 [Triticum aestivum]